MQAEIQLKFNEIDYSLEILKKHIDWDNSIKKINKLSLLTEEQNFWNDTSKAQIIMKEKKQLERLVDIITNIENQKNDLVEILDLGEQENDMSLISDTIEEIDI